MDDDHAYSLMTPRVFYLFKYNDWALRWQGVVLRVLSLWLADMVEIYDWHSAMDMPNIYRASDSHELTHHICSKNHYYNSMIHHRPFGPLMTRERSQSWSIHMANFLFLSMSNIKSAGQTSQFKCKFMITISNWSVWYPQLLLVFIQIRIVRLIGDCGLAARQFEWVFTIQSLPFISQLSLTICDMHTLPQSEYLCRYGDWW